jgi:hypothetical protein
MKTSNSFSVIGWVLTIPLALVALTIIALCFHEGRKAYWDYQIKEFCGKEGDGKVLQTIELTKPEYDRLLNKFGKLEIPLSTLDRSDTPIFQTQESSYIRRADPEVREDKTAIIRRSDGAVLATRSTFSRVGGDLIAFHHSYYSCPENPADIYSGVIVRSKAIQ